MAFIAFGSADIVNGDAILFTVLQFLVEMLIDAVELVAIRSGRIREVDLRSTVTVDTPAHAQRRKLMYLVHLLDRTMAGLTLHFTGCGVLGMAKEDDYVAHRYHNFSDNYTPDMDFTGDAKLARFGLELGWEAITAPATVSWKPGDEFEPARKKSLTQ